MKPIMVCFIAASCLALFVIPAKTATVTITCDNDYTLYFNGVFIGVQDHNDGVSGWDVPEIWDVPLLIGENVVAVRGVNWAVMGSKQGLLAVIELDDGNIIVTEPITWKVTTDSLAGWETHNFDDDSWDDAVTVGMGCNEWPLLAEYACSYNAVWIWAAPLYPPHDFSPEPVVYFRRTFDYTPVVPVSETTWGNIKSMYTITEVKQ